MPSRTSETAMIDKTFPMPGVGSVISSVVGTGGVGRGSSGIGAVEVLASVGALVSGGALVSVGGVIGGGGVSGVSGGALRS